MPNNPLCLGIEASCDETALALVQGGCILGQTLASQADLHALFGGVVPELASREHQRLIGPLLDLLLRQSCISLADIQVIAVTRGPGLLGSLLTGIAFAKGLSLGLGIPLLGINHLHAHLLSVGLEQPLTFPALGLLISGGHSDIYYMESPWQFNRLGRTLDDAAGEVFDKVGHAVGLTYPAGSEVDRLANLACGSCPCSLPRPYLHNDNLDFSFSGLKTAAINLAASLEIPQHQANLPDFCLELTRAIADTLIEKLRRAFRLYPHVKTLNVAGGVAANSIIRSRLAEAFPAMRIAIPSPGLCGDNGVMIAYVGSLLSSQGFFHPLSLEAIPRGQPIPDDMARG